jgi:recombination protein RecA
MRLDVRKIDTIKKGDEVFGNRTRVKIVKNKVSPPFRKAEFDIMYGTGISLSGDILDMATDIGIIDKSGSWYSYNNERIGQGRENVKDYLESNPSVLEEIRGKLMDHLMAAQPGAAASDDIKVDEDGVVIE